MKPHPAPAMGDKNDRCGGGQVPRPEQINLKPRHAGLHKIIRFQFHRHHYTTFTVSCKNHLTRSHEDTKKIIPK